jgi:hypothetical protein
MRFTPDRCLNPRCGSTHRNSFVSTLLSDFPPNIIRENGGILNHTPFWFCSDDCLKDVLESQIDKRFHFERTAYDDPDLPGDYIEEWVEDWNRRKVEAIYAACANLARRAVAEFDTWTNNNCDAYERETQKKTEQLQKELMRQEEAKRKEVESIQRKTERLLQEYQRDMIRREEAQRREQIQLARERERQEDRQRREEERQQREEERQRKLDEAEAERLAEEALYIPHDFDSFEIPESKRMEHTHILGGTGHGKTTLILAQIMRDLRSSDPPAIVVVDGKGTLIQNLRDLALFENNDSMILLDAQDRVAPASLNIFKLPKRGYSEDIREQIGNRTIDLFAYIFTSTDLTLTGQMNTLFSYAIRLMFSMPDATMDDFLDLLAENPRTAKESRFSRYIEQLPRRPRRFFDEEFFNAKEFGVTKQKVRNRINGILEKPTFDAMFSADECKFDMFEALQKRKVVLINAPKPFIGQAAAQLFGRWAIAITLGAAFERLAIPRPEWNPAYLIIDEAQEFVDEEKTPELIQQAREFNLGITIAHQNIKGHLSDNLFAAIASSTSTKYAGGASAEDAAKMAKDMWCTPEFILAQRQIHRQETHFACFVKGQTDRAISVRLPLGAIDQERRMLPAAYEAFLTENRARLHHVPRRRSSKSLQSSRPLESEPSPSTPPSKSGETGGDSRLTSQQEERSIQNDAGEPSDSWGQKN